MKSKLFVLMLLIPLFIGIISFGFVNPSIAIVEMVQEDDYKPIFQLNMLGEINSSFETHVGMYALEYLDGMIYGVDGLTNNLYVYDAETGVSLANHTISTVSQGITTDGTYLYTSVYTLSPPNGTIIKYDTGGNEISRVHVPIADGLLVGLTWDGTYLWAFQSSPSSLLQINTANGIPVKNISISFNPHGLAWYNEKLWAVNWGFDQVYTIHPSTGGIVDSYPSPYHYDSGLAINSTHFIQSRYIDASDPFEISFTKIPSNPGEVFTGSNMILANLRDITYSGLQYFLTESGSSFIQVFNAGLYDFDSSWDSTINPVGITVMEDNYLVVSSDIAPYNFYTFTFDGILLVNHTALNLLVESLAYDGAFLWAMGSDDILYKLDPLDMSIISQFSIGDFAGITYDYVNNVIWAVSQTEHQIKYINITSGEIGSSVIDLNPPITAGEYGLAFNGDFLVIATTAGGGYFYQIISGALDEPEEPIQTTTTNGGSIPELPIGEEHIISFILGFVSFGILIIIRRIRNRS